MQKYYIADLVAYSKIIVEIKALPELTSCEQAQLINYLKATGFIVGLLLNFGNPDALQFKRIVCTPNKGPHTPKLSSDPTPTRSHT